MRYKKFTPVAELKDFVECYFIWEGEAPDHMEIQSPPSGFSAVVFNYGDPIWARQNTSSYVAVPKAFACGQFTSNYQLQLKGKIGMAGIVFKPSSFHNFFGSRMSELVNNRMPLDLLLGKEAETHRNDIINQHSDEGRIDILQDFLICRLPTAKKRVCIIDEAVQCFDRHVGRISVEEVAACLQVSRRYLEKKFLQKVGISPKFYARIKRFSVLSNKIAHSKTVDWQDVVFENGLHDQSHLVKEFTEFNKMSPSDYHLKHSELTRFVTH